MHPILSVSPSLSTLRRRICLFATSNGSYGKVADDGKASDESIFCETLTLLKYESVLYEARMKVLTGTLFMLTNTLGSGYPIGTLVPTFTPVR